LNSKSPKNAAATAVSGAADAHQEDPPEGLEILVDRREEIEDRNALEKDRDDQDQGRPFFSRRNTRNGLPNRSSISIGVRGKLYPSTLRLTSL
jgi:hypothetical protein